MRIFIHFILAHDVKNIKDTCFCVYKVPEKLPNNILWKTSGYPLPNLSDSPGFFVGFRRLHKIYLERYHHICWLNGDPLIPSKNTLGKRARRIIYQINYISVDSKLLVIFYCCKFCFLEKVPSAFKCSLEAHKGSFPRFILSKKNGVKNPFFLPPFEDRRNFNFHLTDKKRTYY